MPRRKKSHDYFRPCDWSTPATFINHHRTLWLAFTFFAEPQESGSRRRSDEAFGRILSSVL